MTETMDPRVTHELSKRATDAGIVAMCTCGFTTVPTATERDAVEAAWPHLIDAEEVERAALPKPGPCPAWCGGHGWNDTGYDSWTDDTKELSRFHGVNVPGGWYVSRMEILRDGVVSLGPVEISYHGDDICTDVAGALALMDTIRAAVGKALEIDR